MCFFEENRKPVFPGAGSCIEDKLCNLTAFSYLLPENLNDSKTGVAFNINHMVITIIILSPCFCYGFVSEVQFHILSAINPGCFFVFLYFVIGSNAFLKWSRYFVTAAKFLLHIQVIGWRVRPAC